MANKIVHWELMGADGDAQKAFYSTIFDWEFAATEGIENYHMTTAEAAGVGGAVGQGNEHMPNYAAMYVEVGDINETEQVDVADLLFLLSEWGVCECCPSDIAPDGIVGINDLLVLLSVWGPC